MNASRRLDGLFVIAILGRNPVAGSIAAEERALRG